MSPTFTPRVANTPQASAGKTLDMENLVRAVRGLATRQAGIDIQRGQESLEIVDQIYRHEADLVEDISGWQIQRPDS